MRRPLFLPPLQYVTVNYLSLSVIKIWDIQVFRKIYLCSVFIPTNFILNTEPKRTGRVITYVCRRNFK